MSVPCGPATAVAAFSKGRSGKKARPSGAGGTFDDLKEDPAANAQTSKQQWNYRKGNFASSMAGVAGRYAGALFSAALEGNVVEQVEQEISAIALKASEDRKFAVFLEDPTIPRLQKKKSMGVITEGMSSVTTEFFGVLAENGRLSMVPKIVEAFAKILAQQRGEVQATITSARNLDVKDMQKLEKALNGFLKPGQKLQLSTKIDERILGGLMVDIGDKHFDLSILGRVNKLKRVLDRAL